MKKTYQTNSIQMLWNNEPVRFLRLVWETWCEMCDFANVGLLCDGYSEGCYLNDNGGFTEYPTLNLGLKIPSIDGVLFAKEGQWIGKKANGELFVVSACELGVD